MRLFGLIGYPLAQSFSKKYFNSFFDKEGLSDCRFENFSIPAITDLLHVLRSNPQLEGLAVTIPYKQLVLPYLDDKSNLPDGLEACNCIRIRDGKLTGYNTDHIGFQQSIIPLLTPQHTHALILGSGGAAEAVKFALRELRIQYKVVSRTLTPASDFTYQELTADVVRSYQVVINTTPLGMFPDISGLPDFPYELLTTTHLLYDLIYNPEQTLFLQKGSAAGAKVKNGSDMLVLQAIENWRIWNS